MRLPSVHSRHLMRTTLRVSMSKNTTKQARDECLSPAAELGSRLKNPFKLSGVRPPSATSSRSILVSTQAQSNSAQRVTRLTSLAVLVAALTLAAFRLGAVGLTSSKHQASGGLATSLRGPITLTVAPNHAGKSFSPGAIGLSVELDELETGDLNVRRTALVGLMRLLGPGVLRLGGNSLEYAWWTSAGEAPPAWATSIINPAELIALRKLLMATGWQVILGVNLGHFNATRAADEASVARHILGSQLLGFEIGNEPNFYGSPQVHLRPSNYGVGNYLQEVTAYASAMHAAAPGSRLYGPDLSSEGWLHTVASAKGRSFSQITQHYYPTVYSVQKGTCEGTSMPTALELLSPQTRNRENATLKLLIEAGETAGRETRISETNTTASCDTDGGPNTSPVFASALWALDWALRASTAGVSGLDFHGYFGRCGPDTFSPICAPGRNAEERGLVMARPEYYGLLAARQLEGGRFVPVKMNRKSALEGLSAYATYHSDGAVTLAVDNLSSSKLTSLLLKMPGYDRASYERLAAPSIDSTEGVTFDGISIDPSNTLLPAAKILPRTSNGAFQLTVKPASAVIVTLHRRARTRVPG